MTEQHPWQMEVDSLDFEAEGLPCKMRRHKRWGTWCGYVGIGQEHPLYGLPPNHLLKLPESWFKNRRGLEGTGPMDFFIHMLEGKNLTDACAISMALQVHGGCNFADHWDKGDEHWWFGFDCGHAGDFMPHDTVVDENLIAMVESMPKKVRATMREIVRPHREGVYRDQQYVVAECQSLAAQLNAIVGVIERESINGNSVDRET